MLEHFYAISHFFYSGGPVMWAILAVAIMLWMLIIERYWYHWRIYPREFGALCARWKRRPCLDPWQARSIQQKEISELRHRLLGSVFLIPTLIAICPLLGLFGTVSGMIQVFDVLGFSGTGSPRAMASGVSQATIPTMSGLVVALSGLFFSIDLKHSGQAKARKAASIFSQHLTETCKG